MGIIPKQWQRFFSESIDRKISNRLDANLYAVYCDYASNRDGEFGFVIGAKVKDGTPPPQGLVSKRVETRQYAVITSDRGVFSEVIPAAWRRVFALEDSGEIKRAYRTDFEVYDQRAQDPQNGEVDIYVGLEAPL